MKRTAHISCPPELLFHNIIMAVEKSCGLLNYEQVLNRIRRITGCEPENISEAINRALSCGLLARNYFNNRNLSITKRGNEFLKNSAFTIRKI